MKPVWLALGAATVMILVYGTAHFIVHVLDNPQLVRHPAGTILAVNFAHQDHIDQNCVECHHNFIDDTGMGMCFDCHKTDAQVTALMEEQFHTLCRSCHEQAQNAGDDHGPTRSCIACHVQDDRP